MSSVTYTGLGKLQDAVEMYLQAVSRLLPARSVGLCLWGRVTKNSASRSNKAQISSRERFHKNMQCHSGSGAPQRHPAPPGHLPGGCETGAQQSHGGPMQQPEIVLLQAKCRTE